MKILHVINGLGSGGTERNLVNYVNNDKKNKHIIFCSALNKFYKTKNTKVYVINKKLNYFNLLNIFFLLRSICKKEKPDIISSWMYRACIFSVLTRLFFNKKIIWNLRNGGDIKFFNLTNRIEYYFASLFSYIVPDITIFNSYTALKNHQNSGFSKKQNFVVHNGFELKYLRKINNHKKHFNICMVARYNYFKNHSLLFKALTKIDKKIDYKLFLIGKNIDKKNYELVEIIKNFNLNKNIILLGEVNDIFKTLRKIDLHILVSNNESFPNVVAESSYYSKISIASKVGDVDKILRKDFIFKNKVSDIKNKIEYFYNLRANRYKDFKSMSKSQSLFIEKNFNIKKMILSFNRIYEKNK